MNRIQEAIEILIKAEDAKEYCNICATKRRRYILLAIRLLESVPEPTSNCQYCGACRMVRPSGKWQYNCECDDVGKRPKKPEPGEFQDKAEAILWAGRYTDSSGTQEFVKEALAEIDRLTTENAKQKELIEYAVSQDKQFTKGTLALEAEIKAKDERIIEAQKHLNCVGENLDEKMIRYCVTKAKQALSG